MVDFAYVFSAFHVTNGVCGMLCNALLIYLALYHTPRSIKTYSTLIVNVAVTDFFACFFDVFVQQRLIPTGLTLAYVSNGPCRHFGPTTCYASYSLLLQVLSHSLWSLLLSFSYRCYILYRPTPTQHLLIFIIFLIYIPSFLQSVSFLWAQDDPSDIREILRASFPSYNLTGQTVTGTKNILRPSCLFTILFLTAPLTPIYICILVLRRTIISKLSFHGVNITKDTRKMHSQLLIALTYQAAIPCFYFICVISYTIGQLGICNHPALEYITCSSILVIPLLSPFASLIFVSPYRKFIKRTFFEFNSSDPIAYPSSQHNVSIHSVMT